MMEPAEGTWRCEVVVDVAKGHTGKIGFDAPDRDTLEAKYALLEPFLIPGSRVVMGHAQGRFGLATDGAVSGIVK